MKAADDTRRRKDRGNGFGSRYDKGTENYVSDYRARTHDAPPIVLRTMILCHSCKQKKPIAGGKKIGGFTSKKFRCKECVAKKAAEAA